jgi:hypothetical protein
MLIGHVALSSGIPALAAAAKQSAKAVSNNFFINSTLLLSDNAQRMLDI